MRYHFFAFMETCTDGAGSCSRKKFKKEPRKSRAVMRAGFIFESEVNETLGNGGKGESCGNYGKFVDKYDN